MHLKNRILKVGFLSCIVVLLVWQFVLGCRAQLQCKGLCLFDVQDSTYIINSNIDLDGSVVEIAEGVTLNFKGGLICNGTLIGNHTQLLYYDKAVFEGLTISGTWNVPHISTILFSDIKKDNVLENVFSLADSSVKNTIHIKSGDYYIVATNDKKKCLRIPSNTDVIIEGSLFLRPNDLAAYSMLSVEDAENVKIIGTGFLVGDKQQHIGNQGEWGMGIKVMNSKNITISGLSVVNMWGDCIYIGKNSQKINILNCNLREGRRQGISITSGKDVDIRDCTIKDIGGTNPQYAIDIEANKMQDIDNVFVDNVEIIDCVGGIKVCEYSKGSHIGDVVIRNCKISVLKRRSFSVRGSDCFQAIQCVINKENKDNISRFIKARKVILDDVLLYGEGEPCIFSKCDTVITTRVRRINNTK